ncbi:MAG: calcium-binding protein [Pseudomonadota bacterium]
MTTTIISASVAPNASQALALDDILVFAADVRFINDQASAVTALDDAVVTLLAGAAVLGFGDAPTFDLTGVNGDYELSVAQGAVIEGRDEAIEALGDLLLSNRGTIRSATESAIVMDDGLIFNYGVIESLGDDGIETTDSVTLQNFGTIVASSTAIEGERMEIINSGVISGSSGIALDRSSAASSAAEIINSGDILAEFAAVEIFNMSVQLTNSGRILSSDDGSSVMELDNPSSFALFAIANSGLIEGLAGAIEIFSGRGEVINTGRIVGDIVFAGADDDYQGRQGRIEGSVDGGAGSDRLIGGAQADNFLGGANGDTLRGNGGDDVLQGDDGADLLGGGHGDDSLFGGTQNDVLNGGGGDDDLFGGENDDVLRGKAGDDSLVGEDGLDVLNGNAGDDTLSGGAGGDTLRGHAGDDSLGGGRGADLILGGRGDDMLTGGQFTDTFVIRRRNDDDVVTDFENGTDVIDLQAFGFFAGQFNAEVLPALRSAGGGATFLDLAPLGGSGSVLIQGLQFAQADASDFIL